MGGRSAPSGFRSEERKNAQRARFFDTVSARPPATQPRRTSRRRRWMAKRSQRVGSGSPGTVGSNPGTVDVEGSARRFGGASQSRKSCMPLPSPRGRITTGCPTCDGFLQSFQEHTMGSSGLFLPDGQRWKNQNPPRVGPQPDPTGQAREWLRVEGYSRTAPQNSMALFGMKNPLRGGAHSTTNTGGCVSCGARLTVHMDHHSGSYGYAEWRR